MKRNSQEFDKIIQDQLKEWEPKIGRPTCGAGCSNCCHRTSVIISPPEALRVLEYVSGLSAEKATFFRKRWEARMTRLEHLVQADAKNGLEGLQSLLSLGSCAFLDGHLCGVYPSRPDACRSFHVWHDADKCGQPNIEMCPPAELAQIRINQFYATLLEEAEAGRIPFWGHLLLMVSLMDQHKDTYLAGEDLYETVAPVWKATNLVHFVKPGGTPEEIAEILKKEREDYADLFAEEPWPMGLPRVRNLHDKQGLEAFVLDPDWL